MLALSQQSFHTVSGKAAVLVARMLPKWIEFLGPRILQLFRGLRDRKLKSPQGIARLAAPIS